jgi:hypothetical protein
MDVFTVWTVAIGIWAADLPTHELRALAKQAALPAGAVDRWDAIGTYTLKGENVIVTVRLYLEDSDLVADKAKRRNEIEHRHYPNSFYIHAVYREGNAPWKYKELYRRARVGFWKVVEVKPEAVTIQVRSKLILTFDDLKRFTEPELAHIFEPQPMKLNLEAGVPILK